jgi:hypothetical protein
MKFLDQFLKSECAEIIDDSQYLLASSTWVWLIYLGRRQLSNQLAPNGNGVESEAELPTHGIFASMEHQQKELVMTRAWEQGNLQFRSQQPSRSHTLTNFIRHVDGRCRKVASREEPQEVQMQQLQLPPASIFSQLTTELHPSFKIRYKHGNDLVKLHSSY